MVRSSVLARNKNRRRRHGDAESSTSSTEKGAVSMKARKNTFFRKKNEHNDNRGHGGMLLLGGRRGHSSAAAASTKSPLAASSTGPRTPLTLVESSPASEQQGSPQSPARLGATPSSYPTPAAAVESGVLNSRDTLADDLTDSKASRVPGSHLMTAESEANETEENYTQYSDLTDNRSSIPLLQLQEAISDIAVARYDAEHPIAPNNPSGRVVTTSGHPFKKQIGDKGNRNGTNGRGTMYNSVVDMMDGYLVTACGAPCGFANTLSSDNMQNLGKEDIDRTVADHEWGLAPVGTNATYDTGIVKDNSLIENYSALGASTVNEESFANKTVAEIQKEMWLSTLREGQVEKNKSTSDFVPPKSTEMPTTNFRPESPSNTRRSAEEFEENFEMILQEKDTKESGAVKKQSQWTRLARSVSPLKKRQNTPEDETHLNLKDTTLADGCTNPTNSTNRSWLKPFRKNQEEEIYRELEESRLQPPVSSKPLPPASPPALLGIAKRKPDTPSAINKQKLDNNVKDTFAASTSGPIVNMNERQDEEKKSKNQQSPLKDTAEERKTMSFDYPYEEEKKEERETLLVSPSASKTVPNKGRRKLLSKNNSLFAFFKDSTKKPGCEDQDFMVRVPGIQHPDVFLSAKDLIGDENLSEASRSKSDDDRISGEEIKRNDDTKLVKESSSKRKSDEDKTSDKDIERTDDTKQVKESSVAVTAGQAFSTGKSTGEKENYPDSEEPNAFLKNCRSFKDKLRGLKTTGFNVSSTDPYQNGDISSSSNIRRRRSAPQRLLTMTFKSSLKKEKKFTKNSNRVEKQGHRKKAMWKAVVDPKSGRTYYYHRTTRETTWTRPPEEEIREKSRVKAGALETTESEQAKKSENADKCGGSAGVIDEPMERSADSSPEVEKANKEVGPRGQPGKEESSKVLKSTKPPYGSAMENLLEQYLFFNYGSTEGRGDSTTEVEQTKTVSHPSEQHRKEEIIKRLKSMKPPYGTTMENLLERYNGREDELLMELQRVSEEQPFDEPLGLSSDAKSSPPVAVQGDNVHKFVEISNAKELKSRQRTGTTFATQFTRSTFGTSGTSLFSGSKVSEKTPQIRNTTSSRRMHVVAIQETDSHATSISSREDDPVTVPRSRELVVEDLSKETGRKSNMFGKIGAVRGPGKVTQSESVGLHSNSRVDPYNGDIEGSDGSTRDTDTASHLNDSISALSDIDYSDLQGNYESPRHRALDDAIAREDWDLAAALSEGMRSMKAAEVNGGNNGRRRRTERTREWTQSELDRFISENDWDAVTNYIARVRLKSKEQEHLGVYNSHQQLPPLPPGGKPSSVLVPPPPPPLGNKTNAITSSETMEESNPHKRFGARSQLQHNGLASRGMPSPFSNSTSGESGPASDDYDDLDSLTSESNLSEDYLTQLRTSRYQRRSSKEFEC